MRGLEILSVVLLHTNWYHEMVQKEIASSEQRKQAKDAKTKSKSINVMTINTAIQQIQQFDLGFNDQWTTYAIASDHYSTINLVGKANPLKSLQECIEGKAFYAIPGYP